MVLQRFTAHSSSSNRIDRSARTVDEMIDFSELDSRSSPVCESPADGRATTPVWSTWKVAAARVEFFQEADRPALCRMLENSDDFPQHLLYLYRRAGSRYATFVARHGDKIDGMLGGSFDADFTENRDFDTFDLPPEPHALLDRIHVRRPARSLGVGRALMAAYVNEVSARGCTFIGGSIDLSSEPTARRAFFERLGFAITNIDNFGARPIDILCR